MPSENADSVGPESAPEFHESGVPFETSLVETIAEEYGIETEQLVESVRKVEGRIEVFNLGNQILYEDYDFLCATRESYWPGAIDSVEEEEYTSAVSELHRRQADKWGIGEPAMVLWKNDVYELEICGLSHEQARFAVRLAEGQSDEEIENALELSPEEANSYWQELVERARQARFYDEWFSEHFRDA